MIPGLYRLLAWLSPGFPTGAFSYSHGLEAAAQAGSVHDRASLQSWVAAIVEHGSGRIDADILCAAYRAAMMGDVSGADCANRRGIAYRPTAELALESEQQGAAFLAAHDAAWTAPHPNPLPARGESERPVACPHPGPPPPAGEGGLACDVKAPPPPPAGEGWGGGDGVQHDRCHAAAFGTAAAGAGFDLHDVLVGYLQAFAGNLVSAGLRLGVIGQTDGQRILAALEPVVTRTAVAALARGPEDFGGATFALDILSTAHETQYSRLFRS